MGTSVDLNEMISFLKSQNKRIVPITRVEAIAVYEEVAALRAQVERLRAVAIKAEWGWWNRYEDDGCPICYGLQKSEGHEPDCPYAAARAAGDLADQGDGLPLEYDEVRP